MPHKRKQCEMCDELAGRLAALDKIVTRLQHTHDTTVYGNIDELMEEYDTVMK